ncbi:CDC42 small effector protein 1 [Takifugu flavidus]|uniref:CDC42 small effector protein 1 n=1 Tax=Takifugu flavidus TaxID=433684 RepID=A0A5C6NFI1_9TELE|nr:CDC42 small effector protein 1 [Takifugu flavidus]
MVERFGPLFPHRDRADLKRNPRVNADQQVLMGGAGLVQVDLLSGLPVGPLELVENTDHIRASKLKECEAAGFHQEIQSILLWMDVLPRVDASGAAVPPPACRAAAQSDGQNVTMSDFWHKMGCCVATKAPPKKKRRKIDRSMIGEPTNFIHLTHIGSGEMADGLQPVGDVTSLRVYGSADSERSLPAGGAVVTRAFSSGLV